MGAHHACGQWGNAPAEGVAGPVVRNGEKEEMVERWGTFQRGNCKRALNLKFVVGNLYLCPAQYLASSTYPGSS